MDIIITIFQGIIEEVQAFHFRDDARKYYNDIGGPELEEDPMNDREIHWYQDMPIHSMPIDFENIENT